MDPIRAYLTDGTLLADQKEVDRVNRWSNWFILYEGILYKQSYAWPLLQCIALEKGKKILEKLHEGVCNAHTGGRTLARMAIRIGYYWPAYGKTP